MKLKNNRKSRVESPDRDIRHSEHTEQNKYSQEIQQTIEECEQYVTLFIFLFQVPHPHEKTYQNQHTNTHNRSPSNLTIINNRTAVRV